MLAKEITVNGLVLDKSTKKIKEGEITYRKAFYNPLTDGQPIDIGTAKKLVGEKKNWEHTKKGQVVAITFRSSVFLQLLGQENCSGIRVYYAQNDNNDKTLVMSGIDSKGDDLKVKASPGKIGSIITSTLIDPNDLPLIIEVGGGDTIEEFPAFP